jgi:tRNA(Ile)-lysidine synthase
MDVTRLAPLAPALQRRLLRHAAVQLGVVLDFAATEAVRSLALGGRAGQRLALPQGLSAERTARELRFSVGPDGAANGKDRAAKGESAIGQERQYSGPIPGTIHAPAFGVCLRIATTATEPAENGRVDDQGQPQTAILRNWKPGDRVRLRYSSRPRKVKEVLERLHVTGTERAVWPVLETDGRIVWMQGVELEPQPGLTITAEETTPETSQASVPNPSKVG